MTSTHAHAGGRSAPTLPPVRLEPSSPATAARRVAAFIPLHADDLAREALADRDQLLRFTRAMVCAEAPEALAADPTPAAPPEADGEGSVDLDVEVAAGPHADADAVPERRSHVFDVVDAERGAIVGYLWTSGHNFGFGTKLYVRHLFIDPPWRRRGSGESALRTLARLTAACHAVSGLALAVSPANQAAARLYARVGFRPFSRLLYLRTLPEGLTET